MKDTEVNRCLNIPKRSPFGRRDGQHLVKGSKPDGYCTRKLRDRSSELSTGRFIQSKHLKTRSLTIWKKYFLIHYFNQLQYLKQK